MPVLDGVQRRADVGVLYDPRRERDFAANVVRALRARGVTVRCNFPYRGTSDGFTSFCRRRLGAHLYLGVEIEVNQARLGSEAAAEAIGREIADAARHALERLGRMPAR